MSNSHRARSKPVRRGLRLWLALVLGTVAAGAVIAYGQQTGFSADPGQGHGQDAAEGRLVRVVDGDTVVVALDGDRQRVRLLNIDAPESVHPDEAAECMGPEAAEHLASLVSPGDDVVLEFDQERTDHYDRLLAGVYVDDELLNERMAREGYGHPVLYQPNDRFLDRIERAWAQAEDAGAGVFADDLACETEPPSLDSE